MQIVHQRISDKDIRIVDETRHHQRICKVDMSDQWRQTLREVEQDVRLAELSLWNLDSDGRRITTSKDGNKGQ
jgi:hypothetical protein